jgi:flagellar biosynthetic protein FliO
MESGFNLIWVLLQTIVALAAVCGLAYLIFRVVLPRLQIVPNGSGGMIRVVERVGLDAKRSLFVIEVAGKWMLVGASENGVNLVSELDAAEAAAVEIEIIEQRAAQIQRFKNLRSDFAATLLRRAATSQKSSADHPEKQNDEKKQSAFFNKK